MKQFNLNNLIRSTGPSGYDFIIRIARRHSYRKASVGLSCEARLAGSIPKITPTATETPKATSRMDVEAEIGNAESHR